MICKYFRKGKISIHAPARGATFIVDILNTVKRDFNPRPREGGDQVVVATILPQIFQSTPPRGGATMDMPRYGNALRFQSTPPRGGGDGRGRWPLTPM